MFLIVSSYLPFFDVQRITCEVSGLSSWRRQRTLLDYGSSRVKRRSLFRCIVCPLLCLALVVKRRRMCGFLFESAHEIPNLQLIDYILFIENTRLLYFDEVQFP